MAVIAGIFGPNTIHEAPFAMLAVMGVVEIAYTIYLLRKPLVVTFIFRLDARLSRQCPRLLIFDPQRLSRVSSTVILMIAPIATNVPTIRCSKMVLKNKPSHFPRFSTWWYLDQSPSCSSPIVRKAAVTVRRPFESNVPDIKTSSF